MLKVEPLDNNVTRKVGIETVIPTIYRYAQADANIRIKEFYILMEKSIKYLIKT